MRHYDVKHDVNRNLPEYLICKKKKKKDYCIWIINACAESYTLLLSGSLSLPLPVHTQLALVAIFRDENVKFGENIKLGCYR